MGVCGSPCHLPQKLERAGTWGAGGIAQQVRVGRLDGHQAPPPQGACPAHTAPAALLTWLRLLSSSSWRLSASPRRTSQQRFSSCSRPCRPPSPGSPMPDSSRPWPAWFTAWTVRA